MNRYAVAVTLITNKKGKLDITTDMGEVLASTQDDAEHEAASKVCEHRDIDLKDGKHSIRVGSFQIN